MAEHGLAQDIHEMALSCGFEDCGIIPVAELAGYEERLSERTTKVPQSVPFYQEAVGAFLRIRESYPWARSALVCTVWLGKYRYPKALRGRYAKSFFLSPEGVPECQAHLDTLRFQAWLGEQGIRWEGGESYGPRRILPLRWAAVVAGLGICRKNNFFYTEKGSYYKLEGYLLDRDLEFRQNRKPKACPEKCDLCRRACGTRALSADYTMNPLACVSFWTTFGKGAVPPPLREEQFGQWICGCDDCQDACPYNRHDWDQGEDFPGLDQIVELMQAENMVKASDEALREQIIPRTVAHVLPDQTATLRLTAARALRSAEAAREAGRTA